MIGSPTPVSIFDPEAQTRTEVRRRPGYFSRSSGFLGSTVRHAHGRPSETGVGGLSVQYPGNAETLRINSARRADVRETCGEAISGTGCAHRR